MIENRKWFKGSRDRRLYDFKVIYKNTDNEENLNKNNLIKLLRNNEEVIAS